MATTTALALALALALVPTGALARTPNYTWQMFRETNQARMNHSVGRLDRAYRLTDAATKHARAMARRGSLFHTSGPSRYNVRCRAWGENVGYTTGDVADLQRAFMKSPSHRRHVLDRTFSRVAVGSATDDRGRLYVTLFFCT
ncbi:MAG: CAP domain-containing protein [Actinomycetota bacterium]|nr:CAP domain-containing protein [Actinomycetota bacterium]MDH5223269.1 CAP domain-containing protein [Actinomycetota bacterium]MDH5313672.1 CAP domain-containing protein [Actinomycetota bacterium]